VQTSRFQESSVHSAKASKPDGRKWPDGWIASSHLAAAVLPRRHMQSPMAEGQPTAELRAFYTALATF
jgi:hypothetical protein